MEARESMEYKLTLIQGKRGRVEASESMEYMLTQIKGKRGRVGG